MGRIHDNLQNPRASVPERAHEADRCRPFGRGRGTALATHTNVSVNPVHAQKSDMDESLNDREGKAHTAMSSRHEEHRETYPSRLHCRQRDQP